MREQRRDNASERARTQSLNIQALQWLQNCTVTIPTSLRCLQQHTQDACSTVRLKACMRLIIHDPDLHPLLRDFLRMLLRSHQAVQVTGHDGLALLIRDRLKSEAWQFQSCALTWVSFRHKRRSSCEQLASTVRAPQPRLTATAADQQCARNSCAHCLRSRGCTLAFNSHSKSREAQAVCASRCPRTLRHSQ